MMMMQDNLMRALMPFLLAIIIWKGTEVMFSKVMRAQREKVLARSQGEPA
jgi:hypothetical protein